MNRTGSDIAVFYNLDKPVSTNFVMRCNGEYVDANGSSRNISSPIDRKHLIHLRSQTEAVVTGGATALAEGYSPTSRFETYVFSRKPVSSGLHRLIFSSSESLRLVFSRLQKKHSRILVEAGPELLNIFLAEHLIDTLFMSVVHETESCKCSAPEKESTDATITLARKILHIPDVARAQIAIVANTVLSRFDCGEP